VDRGSVAQKASRLEESGCGWIGRQFRKPCATSILGRVIVLPQPHWPTSLQCLVSSTPCSRGADVEQNSVTHTHDYNAVLNKRNTSTIVVASFIVFTRFLSSGSEASPAIFRELVLPRLFIMRRITIMPVPSVRRVSAHLKLTSTIMERSQLHFALLWFGSLSVLGE